MTRQQSDSLESTPRHLKVMIVVVVAVVVVVVVVVVVMVVVATAAVTHHYFLYNTSAAVFPALGNRPGALRLSFPSHATVHTTGPAVRGGRGARRIPLRTSAPTPYGKSGSGSG